MKRLNHIYCLLLLWALVACKVEPKSIDYGLDVCRYCSMNIVDSQFASEIVTVKGKVFKYDAIECMLNDAQELQHEVALYLVMDFHNPDTFLEAENSYYLICEDIPSPMGANLSAFKDKETALEAGNAKSGEIYSWEELRKQNLVVIE